MADFQYYLISDRSLYSVSWEEIARSSEDAGVDFFQLREKDLGKRALLDIARRLRKILIHTRFIVNGNLDVAMAAGADGVHLQKNNLPVAAVREHYPQLSIGYSAHSREELLKAVQDGASYAFLSPVFKPLSKDSEATPMGIDQFVSLSQGIGIPVFALGGVSTENIELVRQGGCAGAAGISFFVEHGKFSKRGMVSSC